MRLGKSGGKHRQGDASRDRCHSITLSLLREGVHALAGKQDTRGRRFCVIISEGFAADTLIQFGTTSWKGTKRYILMGE